MRLHQNESDKFEVHAMQDFKDVEILCSYCPDSRVHALIDNPCQNSIDGN